MLQEFKDFALKGNVIDLAVAVIMATTFGGVIKSMVNDVLMPIIGIIAGKPSFDDIKISSIEIGKFLTEVVNFLIVAAALFLLIKALNAMMKTAMKGSDEGWPKGRDEGIAMAPRAVIVGDIDPLTCLNSDCQ